MKIGITFSSLDLLHAVHITMLKEAGQCDYLICTLQTNPTLNHPEKKPIETGVESYISLIRM